jgi:hypothetical protein
MDVAGFEIANDLHGTELYLPLQTRAETNTGSASAPESAKRVGERLAQQADQVIASNPLRRQ